MSKTEQGKTGPASPNLDDLEATRVGGDDFDWGTAIDDWNPTFSAEQDARPDLAGVVIATEEPLSRGTGILGTGNAASEPSKGAAQGATQTVVATGTEEGPAIASLEKRVDDVSSTKKLQVMLPASLGRGPGSDSVDATLTLDSREMERLTSIARFEPMQPSKRPPAAAGPTPADEDFYDDIEVGTGSEEGAEKSEPATHAVSEMESAGKTTPPAGDGGDDELTIQIEVGPVETAGTLAAAPVVPTTLVGSATPAIETLPSQPAVGESSPPLAAEPALDRGRAADAVKKLAKRLPLPSTDQIAIPALTQPGGASAPDTSLRRHFLAMLEGERTHWKDRDVKRAAKLTVAVARQAEALRDRAEALDLYRSAAEQDEGLRAAVRGMRRLLSWAGPISQPDEATTLINSEMTKAGPLERQGMQLVRGELLRVQGDLAGAESAYKEITKPTKGSERCGALAGSLGLLELALQRGGNSDIGSAIDRLLSGTKLAPSISHALKLMRARLEEQAGREAQSRYEELMREAGQTQLAASLGTLRGCLRTKKGGAAAATLRGYELIKGNALPKGLQGAVLRQIALKKTGAERAEALCALGAAGDWVALEDGGRSWAVLGESARAGMALGQLAEQVREPMYRAMAQAAAGTAMAQAGKPDEARQWLRDAVNTGGAADLSQNHLALVRLDRLVRQTGDSAQLETLGSLGGRLPSEQVAALQYERGRALVAENKPTEALAALELGLLAVPGYGPAVELAVECLLGMNRGGQAAQVLLAAAEAGRATDRPELLARNAGYRERAAWLMWGEDKAAEALQVTLSLSNRWLAEQAPSVSTAARWRVASLAWQLGAGADRQIIEETAMVLGEDAAKSASPHRAAALYALQGQIVGAVRGEPTLRGGTAEESYRRALEKLPGHRPSLFSLLLRGMAKRAGHGLERGTMQAIQEGLRERMLASNGRPEALIWGLRLGAFQEQEGSDPVSALATFQAVRSLAPDHSTLVGLEESLFVTAWRAGQALDALERDLVTETDSERRYALLLLAGEKWEGEGHPARAAERYAQALEQRPGHPVAKAALVRAYQAAGMLDELAKFTQRELKEATDVHTRVSAYERQGRLAGMRGDGEGVITANRSVLTIDTNNNAAMRSLEQHYIASQQWGELIHLYEQMGLTASDTSFAVHINLDRARLRQRLAWHAGGDEATLLNELENDYRLALYRDQHCIPALRFLLIAAERKNDKLQIATLSKTVAEICAQAKETTGGEGGDKAAGAVFLLRAAEALSVLGRETEDVLAVYDAALKQDKRQIGGLRSALHLALLHGDLGKVCGFAESLAEALHTSDEKYLHYMLAGTIAQGTLAQPARAEAAYLAGLQLDSARDEAFERLRSMLGTQSASSTAAAERLRDLLISQLGKDTVQGERLAGMRLELAQLLSRLGGTRAQVRQELEKAQLADPSHVGVLAALGKLLSEDGEWSRSAELMERHLSSEKRPMQQLTLHMRLGEMYKDKLQNQAKAIEHYGAVLSLSPHNQVALTQLVGLFTEQKQHTGAVALLLRLVKYTTDKGQRLSCLHQIAVLCEEHGEGREALEALRKASEVDPMHLPTIKALAKLYERQKDAASMRIHLDRAAARFRPMLRERPRDVDALQALQQIFVWKGQGASARITASVLTALGGTVSSELRAEIEKLGGAGDASKINLRAEGIDDLLYPGSLPPGLRGLFGLAHEALHKLYGSDGKKLAQLGVDRREKLPRNGHPVRDTANKLAQGLGLGEFDVYVTSAQRTLEEGKKEPLCTVELVDVPSLIISGNLLEGATEAGRRFVLGGLLKLVQSHLILPLSASPYELGLLLGGLIRACVPSFSPIGYAEKQVANEAARIKKALPSKLQGQLLPHAMESSSGVLDFDGIAEGLRLSAQRAGLLLSFDLPSALSMLRKRGPAGEGMIDELLRFAVSEEYATLVKRASES